MIVVVTPGHIALTTGSLASVQGFGRTIPLIAGIATGTAVLAAFVAIGAVHFAEVFSSSAAKVAGAAVLLWLAWRLATAAPPASEDVVQPRKLQAGLFAGGFLISFLAPQSASFFAVAFTGMMLPIREIDEALTVAVIAAVFGAGWYALVAAALSHPAARALAMRRYKPICRTASSLLAIMAVLSVLSAFPSG
ncbi:LysE family transporter [Chelativorans sp.]|uniref:LysE family translocator n=1 Tax=Chelativorans sp. TaxID=2203393 RepID=UPI00281163B1|nr:LysE family transporter [Chelativorans sp.]